MKCPHCNKEILPTKSQKNIGEVISHYKKIKGYDKIPNWNKIYYKRFVRDAKNLLVLFEDDIPKIKKVMNTLAKKFKEQGLSWNLSTIVKWSPEELKSINKREKREKVLKEKKNKALREREKAREKAVPMPEWAKEELKEFGIG